MPDDNDIDKEDELRFIAQVLIVLCLAGIIAIIATWLLLPSPIGP